MILVCEGIDSCGKGTQVPLLAKRLRQTFAYLGRQDTVETGKFPGRGSVAGQVVNQLLHQKIELSGSADLVTARAVIIQALMTVDRYAASWMEHYSGHPENHIILDRYYASGIAYGKADGLPERWLRDIHSSLPMADYWFLLDISPETSEKRRPIRRDEYERRNNFMGKVRDNYLDLFIEGMKINPKQWLVINGERDEVEVTQDVLDSLDFIR